LSLRAEIVRWNAGNEARAAILIEHKQFRVRPDVARIRRNKKGQVTDQSHAFCMRVFLELIALAEQQKLRKADSIDLIGQLSPRAG